MLDVPLSKRQELIQLLLPIQILLIPFLLLVGYLLWPGHLLPGNINVDFQIEKLLISQQKTAAGILQKSQTAIITITNKSGNTLWYNGLMPGAPDMVIYQFSEGKWQWLYSSATPGKVCLFGNGETFSIKVPLHEKTTAIMLDFAVSSSWLDRIDHWIGGSEIQIKPTD